MYRRKVMGATAAVFAIGVAFAAQPTSFHADGNEEVVQQRSPWVPGTNTLMSAHEPGELLLMPPR